MHVLARRDGVVSLCRFPVARLGLAVSLVMSGASHAQQVAMAVDTPLKETVVSATRMEQDADTVAATVTTISAAEIDRRMPADETDLFANDPDLAVARNSSRFGSATVNIRGIEGTRVLNLVDGVRLPDYYGGGGPSNVTVSDAGGPHLDFLKRVEVLRGPASSLYGSDALGGVVSYVTKEPEDFLTEGKPRAFGYQGTYRSADQSLSNTMSAAIGDDVFKYLLMVNRTDGKELETKGAVSGTSTARTKANPEDKNSSSLLSKFVWLPAPGHRLAFVIDYRNNQADTDVQRLISSLPKTAWMKGNDDTTRTRYGLDWEWKPQESWVDRLKFQAYQQNSEARTLTDSLRANTSAACSASSGSGNNCLLRQDFRMEQDRTSLGLQLDKLLEVGKVSHLLVAGADWSRTRVSDYRDFSIANTAIATGIVTYSKTLAGTTYPSRGFAPGHTDSLGLFFQDAIGFDEGRFTVTPGLRYDRVELKPKSDAIFSAQSFAPAVGKTDSRVSPKVAMLWQLQPSVALYGQYVEGFRAPNYSEVNGFFQNGTLYASIPNADLKPETSYSTEMGMRLKQGPVNLSFARYDNRYKNFIDNVALTCPSNPSCVTGLGSTYQSINLSRVRIQGWETRGAWDLGGGYRLDGAYAFTRGDDEGNHTALNSVEPARATVALAWNQNVHGGEARIRAAERKAKDRISGSLYSTAGYGVLDLSAWWKISTDMKITAALNNVFDRKYMLWSDVRFASLAQTTAGMDFYTQPGRNLSLGLSIGF
jgi:hemoglobin/transferrin/lactoferrin receptor protein